MTDIEQKALALLNEVMAQHCHSPLTWNDLNSSYIGEALCRAIEQHEAFRQEVSDALSVYQKADGVEERSRIWDALTRFIIPKPVDPVREVFEYLESTENFYPPEFESDLRAAMLARGYEFTKIGEKAGE